MNDKEKEKWIKVRAKGQMRYLLVEGIIKSGIPFALFMTIFYYLQNNGFTVPSLKIELTDSRNLFTFLFSCIFFGLWMGLVHWYSSERKFKNNS